MANVQNRNIDRKLCCGCTACATACPSEAIRMKKDRMGFEYPSVDAGRCTDCGFCLDVCQFQDGFEVCDKSFSQLSFAARDEISLGKSQSGGMGYAFMKWMVENGGIVYGVGMDDSFLPVYKRARSLPELEEFRLSKYAQSRIGKTIPMVKKDLEDGFRVLFIGTGCLVSGLLSVIPRHLRTNLFTIDIVCHGVPAPSLWTGYLDYLRKKKGKAIKEAVFRDPSCGWHSIYETVDFGDEKITVNDYSFLFMENIALRPSCGNCHFASLKRSSDITIGDCWGIEKVEQRFDDGKPWSLVLCNSRKGSLLFEKLSEGFTSFPIDVSAVLQPNLKGPTSLSARSDIFEKDFINRGFEYVNRKYGRSSIRHCLKAFVAKIKRHL